MTLAEIARVILLSAAVFVPVLVFALVLSLLATRFTTSEATRRRERWCLAAGSVAVAGVGTALLWVGGTTAEAETLEQVLVSLAAVMVTYLAILLAVGFTNQRLHDDVVRLKTRKILIYVGTLVILLTLLKVWVLRHDVNYTLVFTVLGAGLALALHQVVLCLTGWMVLQFQRYYDVGDRVQIGKIRGDVSDISLLHTTLVEFGEWVAADQSTGRLVTLPNSWVFTEPIHNYTRGFQYIWNELSVLVTFESDWRRAQQIMTELANEGVEEIQERFRSQVRHLSEKYMILHSRLTPIVYQRILDSGVQLTLRYLTEPKRRRGTESELSGKILDAFGAEPTIEFAYPTTRFYDAAGESKPALRPKPMPPA